MYRIHAQRMVYAQVCMRQPGKPPHCRTPAKNTDYREPYKKWVKIPPPHRTHPVTQMSYPFVIIVLLAGAILGYLVPAGH